MYRKHEPLDVVVKGTGLKVYGEGEWKFTNTERANARTWRKLHIAMDVKTQQIVAAEMTSISRNNVSVVPELLTHIDGKNVSLCDDGAYENVKFTV